MEKIALLPGGFKPPHAGHYNMAKWLADNTKARELLGWEPTGNVEEWLRGYIDENLRDDTN